MTQVMDEVDFYSGGRHVVLTVGAGSASFRPMDPPVERRPLAVPPPPPPPPPAQELIETVPPSEDLVPPPPPPPFGASAPAPPASPTASSPPATRKDGPAKAAGLPSQLKISVSGGVTLAQLPIIGASETALHQIFRSIEEAVTEAGVKVLILDMASVNFLSSHAIERLVSLQKFAAARSVKIRLLNASDDVQTLLTQMRLDALFPRVRRLEEALALR
jgi:anti-anti-sigma factor